MYNFNAEIVGYTIKIESDTYWSCKAEGNFKLSKYDGSGDDVIIIEIPKDVIIADGIVHFSYGDERCNYPTLAISITNYCYIETTPKYDLCDGKKTLYLFYKQPKETFKISVVCYNNWIINNTVNVDCITANNEIFVIFGNDNGGFTIVPQGCGISDMIYVKTIKKADS